MNRLVKVKFLEHNRCPIKHSDNYSHLCSAGLDGFPEAHR